VLTRSDLARAPLHVKSEAVQKSRATVIQYLLEQDGPKTLAWLAQEARQQARAREAERAHLGCIATFWSGRATSSADALAVMAAELSARDLKQCG